MRSMFVTDCQACGLRELRGARSIELLVRTGRPTGGVDLVYRCTRCDTVNAPAPAPAAAAAPGPRRRLTGAPGSAAASAA